MLAADRCPGCGNRWSECTDPDTVWEVAPLTRCQACTAISQAREASTADHQQAAYYFAHRVVEGVSEE